MKSWLEKNDMEIYLSHNERKSVVTERFLRKMKNKIYKYLISISKDVYIDKLGDMAKNTLPWNILLVILKENKFLERFTKNNCKKQIKKGLELKK